MEKKQTSVQWLINHWTKLQKDGEKMTWQQIIDITNLALQMEREQIEEAYWQGHNDLVNYNRKDIDTSNISISASDYYNQTFKP